MKRRLLTLLIFLLAGAVVNVAVAWGVVAGNPPIGLISGSTNLSTQHARAFFDRNAPEEWPELTSFNLGDNHIIKLRGVTQTCAEAFSHPPTRTIPPYPDRYWVCENSYGLPLRSLRFVVLKGDRNMQVVGRWKPLESESQLTLPYLPLWPGFALNTLLYAAILWPLICGPFALRRLVRVRRGLCPACAYPIGEAATCSECGKPLPRRAVTV